LNANFRVVVGFFFYVNAHDFNRQIKKQIKRVIFSEFLLKIRNQQNEPQNQISQFHELRNFLVFQLFQNQIRQPKHNQRYQIRQIIFEHPEFRMF